MKVTRFGTVRVRKAKGSVKLGVINAPGAIFIDSFSAYGVQTVGAVTEFTTNFLTQATQLTTETVVRLWINLSKSDTLPRKETLNGPFYR